MATNPATKSFLRHKMRNLLYKNEKGVEKIIFPGQKQLCIVIAVSELTTRVRRCSVLMSTLQIYVAQPPVPDEGFMQRVRI